MILVTIFWILISFDHFFLNGIMLWYPGLESELNLLDLAIEGTKDVKLWMMLVVTSIYIEHDSGKDC